MARPFKLDGFRGIIEMSDSHLDRLCYYLRSAYSDQLNSGGQGSLSVGGSGTTIGTMTDTARTQQVNTGSNTQPNPGTGVNTNVSGTYTYIQDRTIPSSPSDSTINDGGFVIMDSNKGVITADEAEIVNTVITQTIADMRAGDEVGTYRVATSNPGNGTWTNKGTWFVDTTYTGTTTYKLWLKRTMAVEPGTYVYPIARDSNKGLKEVEIAKSSNLIQNILLPILTRNMSSGLYYLHNVNNDGINRGVISDTRLSGTTHSQSNPPAGTDPGPSDIYRTFSTPSGSAANHTIEYFKMV
tara:strand:+ start:4587 stop:5477 length:891 start_codon:yes stop_codon:yes gene_type:complete